MIRLIIVTIISCVIFSGAISKNILAWDLLNHVSEHHSKTPHYHKHEHKHTHKQVSHVHHSDASDEPGQPEEEESQPNHSHSFEISLLTLPLSVSLSQEVIIGNESRPIEKKVDIHVSDINIIHFSSTVFRPPIA